MRIGNEKIGAVVRILKDLKEFIRAPDTSILHSRFESLEDIIAELDTHILKLQKEDFSSIEELIILFAPTSDLQEISIDSGWGELYLTISKRFDSVINDLIKEFKVKPFSNR